MLPLSHAQNKMGGENDYPLKSFSWIRKPLLILVILYLFALSALLRADYNYIDDSGRVVAGYRGWDNWSRYISNILAKLIHTQNQLTDISPATQILAIVFMSLAGLCLLYIFNHKKNFTVCELIAVLPLGLNPWFLECFSYKFDSPYMTLSVLASIVLFYGGGKRKNLLLHLFLVY